MKTTCILYLLWTLMACQTFGTEIGLTNKQKDAPPNEWGALIDNAQVSIALNPATNEVVTNQNVQLIARIKNLSTNEVFDLYVANAFLDSRGFSFEVISPSGKDVSPAFSNTFTMESGVMLSVPSGKVDGFIVDLHQFCKLDELGTYKITMLIQRWVDRRKFYNVVSNPFFMTVVPDINKP